MLHPSITEGIAAAVFEGRIPLLPAWKRLVIKSVARYKGYISVNLRYFPCALALHPASRLITVMYEVSPCIRTGVRVPQ
jgi:hypothetical protein